jgi:hypothetical protein
MKFLSQILGADFSGLVKFDDATPISGLPVDKLSNVEVVDVQPDDFLMYNSSTQQWENGQLISTSGDNWSFVSSSFTTTSINIDGVWAGTHSFQDTNYQLTKVSTSAPARVRFYINESFRDSDVLRQIGEAPSGEHGLVAEVITSASNLDIWISEAVFGFSANDPASNLVAITVDNLSGTLQTIQVDLEYYALGATTFSIAQSIGDLDDVVISNPSENDVLQYNSSTGNWENSVSSGGGGGSILANVVSVIGTDELVVEGVHVAIGTQTVANFTSKLLEAGDKVILTAATGDPTYSYYAIASSQLDNTVGPTPSEGGGIPQDSDMINGLSMYM